jgi:hypothetical protein
MFPVKVTLKVGIMKLVVRLFSAVVTVTIHMGLIYFTMVLAVIGHVVQAGSLIFPRSRQKNLSRKSGKQFTAKLGNINRTS